MNWLTQDSVLLCTHKTGVVAIAPTQSLVTINGRRVLVDADPERKGIAGCSNFGPTIKPCTLTLNVEDGYSTFIRINGKAVCLDTVTGKTDGTPPGTVYYTVKQPGQTLVNQT